VNRAALLKQLDALITWLECGDEERPKLFGSHDEHEWLLRLSGIARSLLTRHRTDAKGRCRRCWEPRKGILSWIPRRRMPCRILARTVFFATSEIDVVWWQVLSLRGDDIALDEVRAWLDSSPEAQAEEPAKHAAVIADERVQPYYWGELPTGRMPVRPDEAETQGLPRLPRTGVDFPSGDGPGGIRGQLNN
jgi:hypothetical protein